MKFESSQRGAIFKKPACETKQVLFCFKPDRAKLHRNLTPGTMLTRNQRQNGIQRHRLLVLIKDLHRPLHHAGRFFFGIALTFHRFAFAG